MTGKLTPCTPEQIEILKKQPFSDTEPGTLLKDFNSLLAFIGKTGIAVSEKTQLFALNTLADINRLLTHPLDVKLKRPVQKSFPYINGLYLLLRSSGLSYVVPDGKKTKLMLYEDVLADWSNLTPAECYFSLLQAFYYRADAAMLGERQSFLAPTCFYDCLLFFQKYLGDRLDVKSHPDTMYRLRFSPGLHNLTLMELFGFIDVECTTADENETWPLSVIKPTDWGRTIFGYFSQNNLVMSFLEDDEHDQAGSSIWENEFKKYIPAWEKSLIQVERNITEEGGYIFNVSLGKASCKIAVPAESSLDELAYGILAAFDFNSDHLYEFIYKNEYGIEESIAHPEADSDHEYCTADCPVGYLPLYKGMTFIFHFDFGDDWEFKIRVEAMPSAESNYSELTVIEKRGTPPEQYTDWDDEYEDDD
ncbi:MAG: IS1096 element passenger TnpR family protein [Methylobacter sp.]